MGGLVSSLGFGAGGSDASAGTKFSASGTNILQPANIDQANQLYNQSQNGLQMQSDFLNALVAQNGIQNQSDVYKQLSGIASGQGPNPAQAMLNQQTGNNIAQQAALQAGQRGAGANVGLIARQVGQQGATLQQQAVGQGATLQAQQALNAINQMGGIASQQVANRAAATQGYNQAAQSEQQNILNAIGQQNQSNVGMQSNRNSANAGIANTVAQGQQNLAGNIFGGIGSAVGLAAGGEVPKYEEGGSVVSSMIPAISVDQLDPNMPKSNVGKFHLFNSPPSNQNWNIAGSGTSGNNNLSGSSLTGNTIGRGVGSGIKALAGMFGGNKSVDMAGGAADEVSANSAMEYAAKGGQMQKPVVVGERLASQGKLVPGKAKVKGDNYKNDIIDAKLSPGEIVIPRSIAQSPDAPRKSAAFVAAILAKNGKLPKKK